MPLQPGDSAQVIKQNIAEMVRAGHPVAQAVAAAMRTALDSKKKKKPAK